MPFDPAFDDVYKLGIKETCEKLGITAERVDEQIFHKQNILERIYAQIELADFVIADMTGRNPNVFYEVGYAHGKSKICLLLTSNTDDIPFDLKHHRHLVYGNSIQNLRQSLERDLGAVKFEVANRKSVITVGLSRTDALVERTEYRATGKVELSFDLRNKTGSPSPEIEAIYFHTGSGWSFEQDGQQCLSTESSDPNFLIQHFIKSPVRRLSPGGWAQIKITGSKVLGVTWKGDVLQDTYRLHGRSLVKIVTAEGPPFEYPIEIDVEADEIPF
jgi:nucleoside 2-deoxyribosyltransferase